MRQQQNKELTANSAINNSHIINNDVVTSTGEKWNCTSPKLYKFTLKKRMKKVNKQIKKGSQFWQRFLDKLYKKTQI